jgi:peptide/nickel transport system substrate-binding protein
MHFSGQTQVPTRDMTRIRLLAFQHSNWPSRPCNGSKRRVRRINIVVLSATFALVAAACSSSDSIDTTEPTVPSATETGDWCSSGNSAVEAASTAGAGDNLLLFQWQAPSQANGLISAGTKDLLAGSIVNEPLIEFAPDGTATAALAVEVPTVENGGIAEDSTSVTFNLRDCVLWSDGTPFTSADVVFSYEYCLDTGTGCSSELPVAVSGVEALGDLQVKVSFVAPQPFPFIIFSGYQGGTILQKAQFEPCIGAASTTCTEQNFAPIGTGPYVVTELRPEDTVLYAANPLYRGAANGKPFFSTVEIKGGGDAVASARSVLEIGEGDYAWNLQVAPEILLPMEEAGNGRIVTSFTADVEIINLNQTNGRPDGDPRSEFGPDMSNTNPYFWEAKVLHDALSIAINREEIVAVAYGSAGAPTCNIWPVGSENSPNNTDLCTYSPELAKKMLDDAGYVDTNGDGVRETPDGLELSWEYVTSTNAVRQTTQDLVKRDWEAIGVKLDMRNEDAGLFFDQTCASDVCIWKFFTDIQMFTSPARNPFAAGYLESWRTDQLPTEASAWGGGNLVRMFDEDFDALQEELSATPLDDPSQDAIVHELNDIIVGLSTIPLIHRGSVSGISNTITGYGEPNGWDSEYWNIEEWARG